MKTPESDVPNWMVDQVTLFSVVELLIGLIAAVVAYVAWGYRERPAGTPLTVMAGAIACWAFANGLHSLVSGEALTTAFSHATYLFTAIGVIAWFYVAVEYTDEKVLQSRVLFVLLVGFVVYEFLVLVTDPFLHLFMRPEAGVHENGYYVVAPAPLYYVHVVVLLVITLVGIGLYGRAFWTARGVYRKQTGAIMVSAFLAMAFVLFQISTSYGPPGFSLSMVGMTILCSTLLWVIFVAEFFETVPVARELLVESMDDAVIAVNNRNRVVDLNPKAIQLLAVDDGAIGDPVTEVLGAYPELLERFESTYDADTELEIERDGETRHYDISISPVIPEGKAGVGAERRLGRIIVIRDITDQVRRQNQLEAQKAQLERQNERLDQFASVISHDLRNPLNTARGFLDVARETGEEEHYEKVEQSHERMETMIEELLTLARAETDIDQADLETVPLRTLVDEAWETAATNGATLETEIPDGWTVEADSSLLRNVLENLFRNAADHNQPPLTVRLGVFDDASGFYVEDDGTGIPAEDRDEIFEHGYTTDAEGTGFGLSIVSELIEAHGWTIEVTESSDGGARFEIDTV